MPKAIENAHDAILATTRRLLASEGYDNLGMRSIASASGIATGTIYKYYAAKDEIVYAVMLEDWRITLEGMDADIGEFAADIGCEEKRILRAGKLSLIFTRLRNFTGAYSDVWRRMALLPNEEKSPRVRCYDRTLFMEELSIRIRRAISRGEDCGIDENAQFCVDLVARIFSLYAMERDFDYSRLEAVLKKIF
jgi:AcrR family transcriptional regulator